MLKGKKVSLSHVLPGQVFSLEAFSLVVQPVRPGTLRLMAAQGKAKKRKGCRPTCSSHHPRVCILLHSSLKGAQGPPHWARVCICPQPWLKTN